MSNEDTAAACAANRPMIVIDFTFMSEHSFENNFEPADEWDCVSEYLDESFPIVVTGIFSQYEILERIQRDEPFGRLPYSKCFRGRDVNSPDTLVFIKFANAEMINDEWEVRATITETPFRHGPSDRSPPSGVEMENDAEESGLCFHFIVSPFVKGYDLQKEKLYHKTILDYIQQMWAAFAMLNAQGSAHRRMPSNVFVDLGPPSPPPLPWEF
jgi:hypothetical protein